MRTRTTPASRGHAVKLALTAPAAATPRCLLCCAKVSLVLPEPRREREIPPLRRGDTIPFPLCEGGYRGVPMARQHGTRQPAPGRRDGHDHRRGAWGDKASGTGHRDGHDHSSSLEPHSGGRSEPGGVSPRSPRWHDQIPCLVPHTGNGAPVVRGLVSTRRGSEELGMIARFWPGACATNLRFACPFGSWLQGPEVNLQWGHGNEAVEDVFREEWASQCLRLFHRSAQRSSGGLGPKQQYDQRRTVSMTLTMS